LKGLVILDEIHMELRSDILGKRWIQFAQESNICKNFIVCTVNSKIILSLVMQ